MPENGAVELYRRYRPTKFQDVLGQEAAVTCLRHFLRDRKLPHALLFMGGSGVGKTTLARILKNKLHCSDLDFFEINCASLESVMDTVRFIDTHKNQSPAGGSCRIWILDEVQSLSRAGFAQQALLKMLEDTPAHCYFILCTTDASKLLPTILTRCTTLKLKPLSLENIRTILETILEKEGKTLAGEVVQKIVACAEGSAREALKLLHQVLSLSSVADQLGAIEPEQEIKKSIDLCRALLDPHSRWSQIRQILEVLQGQPEKIRQHVLKYASSTLLKGGKQDRAYLILICFEKNWHDSGRNGLIRACYEVYREKS